MRILLLVPAIALLVAPWLGCGAPAPPPPEEPLSVSVGAHRIQLVPPADWDHLDHGREHRFEGGGQQISLADLGPVTPAAIDRVVQQARRFYEAGRMEDARTLLLELNLQPEISGEERRRAFNGSWSLLTRLGKHSNPPRERVVQDSFTGILEEVRQLPRLSMEEWSEVVLPALDHNNRRDIAEEGPRTVDGREAWQFDTWESLNHTGRRRHLILIDEGHLLAMRMELGQFERMAKAFEGIVASIRFSETD